MGAPSSLYKTNNIFKLGQPSFKKSALHSHNHSATPQPPHKPPQLPQEPQDPLLIDYQPTSLLAPAFRSRRGLFLLTNNSLITQQIKNPTKPAFSVRRIIDQTQDQLQSEDLHEKQNICPSRPQTLTLVLDLSEIKI